MSYEEKADEIRSHTARRLNRTGTLTRQSVKAYIEEQADEELTEWQQGAVAELEAQRKRRKPPVSPSGPKSSVVSSAVERDISLEDEVRETWEQLKQDRNQKRREKNKAIAELKRLGNEEYSPSADKDSETLQKPDKVLEAVRRASGPVADEIVERIESRDLTQDEYDTLRNNVRDDEREVLDGLDHLTNRHVRLMRLSDDRLGTSFLDITSYQSPSMSAIKHAEVTGFIGDLEANNVYEGVNGFTHVGNLEANKTFAKNAKEFTAVGPSIQAEYDIGHGAKYSHIESVLHPMRANHIGHAAEHSTFKNIASSGAVGFRSQHCSFYTIRGNWELDECLEDEYFSTVRVGPLAEQSNFYDIKRASEVGTHATQCTFKNIEEASNVGQSAKQSTFRGIRDANCTGVSAERCSFHDVHDVRNLGVSAHQCVFEGLSGIEFDGRNPAGSHERSDSCAYEYKDEGPMYGSNADDDSMWSLRQWFQ